MAANLVVPSDITLVEEQNKIGNRKLRFFEWTGLLGMAPMIHLHYSKLDKGDMRAVLQKKYDPESNKPAVDICRRRQESIRKNVIATNYMWGTSVGFAGMASWSLRRYKFMYFGAPLIVAPFFLYGGMWFGRVVGDIASGRNAEYGRDRFLGSLPGKVYYSD